MRMGKRVPSLKIIARLEELEDDLSFSVRFKDGRVWTEFSAEELHEHLKDPWKYEAEFFEITIEEYREFIENHEAVRCAAVNKDGERCKWTSSQILATDLHKHKGWICTYHKNRIKRENECEREGDTKRTEVAQQGTACVYCNG